MITQGEQISRDVVESCEVVVVGSGAGGGAIAAELAEAGVEVVILEEGGYYTSKDFSLDPRKATPMLYRDSGASAILGKPNIFFQEGRCVGGSTVINGGMCWRAPEKVLERWRWEMGLDLTPENMLPFYEKVEERINVAPQSPESLGKSEMLFRKAADRLGWMIHPNKRNQKGCTGEGICIFGCPTDKKQSVLITYIPRALNNGARLYTDVKIKKVKFKDRIAVGVEGVVLDRRTGKKRPHKITVKARTVIVAGGALQSPVLLWNSGLKNRNIGKHFHCHPNVKVVGVFDEPVHYWKSVHQGHQVHHFIDEGILLTMSVVIHPAILPLSFPQFGKASIELMEKWNHMVVGGALVDDTTTGVVKKAPWGDPLAYYNIDDVEHERLLRATALASKLMFEMGAKSCILPFAHLTEIKGPQEISKIYKSNVKKEEIEIPTVHAFGTSRIGASDRWSVSNPWGETWEAERLFVVDSGMVPTSLGVNPQETIMALSTRTGQYILDNKDRYLG